MPSCPEISLPMATSSPVTILTLSPCSLACWMVSLESSRGGSSIEQDAEENSSSCRRRPSSATPSARMPLAAKSATVLSALAAVSVSRLAQCDDDLRRALGVASGPCPRVSVTWPSVRLPTGSKGMNLVTRVAVQGLGVRTPPLTALSMASSLPFSDASAPARISSSAESSRRTGSGRRGSARSW